MAEDFNALFKKGKETAQDKGPIYNVTKMVKTKEGKKEEREFVSIKGVLLEINKEGRGTQYSEEEFADFALDDKTMKLLEIYAKGIKLGKPPLVEGPTDIGKSRAIQYLAFKTNNYLITQPFNVDTDVSELIGKIVPNTESDRKTFERLLSLKNRKNLQPETQKILNSVQGSSVEDQVIPARSLSEDEIKKIAKLEGLEYKDIDWIWSSGTVPQAMTFNNGRGCWLLFDELGAGQPQVLVRLNQVLTRDKIKRLFLTEYKGEEVVAGKSFQIFATTNPPSYAGREPLATDFVRRWLYQKVSDLNEKEYNDRLNFIVENQESAEEYEIIDENFIDLSKKEAKNIAQLLNELITLFAFVAQKYLDKIPKDIQEQPFQLRELSDAIAVQQYLCSSQLQGADLLETLKEAVDFVYLNKIDENKKDTSGKIVQEYLRDTLEQIIEKKKARTNLKKYIKEYQQAKEKKQKEEDRRRLKKQRSETEKIEKFSATTPEGREVTFDLNYELKFWQDFYRDFGIDWGEMPSEIIITKDQMQEMIRLIEKYGFDTMLIVPGNLVPEMGEEISDENKEHYKNLCQKLIPNFSESELQQLDLEKIVDERGYPRIILTKQVQNIEDDDLFRETQKKSVYDLENEIGVFAEHDLDGFSLAEYLALCRYIYEKYGQHLDNIGSTWLPRTQDEKENTSAYAGWFKGLEGKPDAMKIGMIKHNKRGKTRGSRLCKVFEIY